MAQKPPEKEPDRTGPTGVKAWKITVPEEKLRPEHAAGLDQWLVYHAGSHPFWSYYCVGLIHLRDIEGAKPANLRYDAATHEIMFVSLSPDVDLPDVDAWESPTYLQPIDVAAQFTVNDDEQARNVLAAVMDTIVERGAALDQDHRNWWEGAIGTTARHEREGLHSNEDRRA